MYIYRTRSMCIAMYSSSVARVTHCLLILQMVTSSGPPTLSPWVSFFLQVISSKTMHRCMNFSLLAAAGAKLSFSHDVIYCPNSSMTARGAHSKRMSKHGGYVYVEWFYNRLLWSDLKWCENESALADSLSPQVLDKSHHEATAVMKLRFCGAIDLHAKRSSKDLSWLC